MHVVNKVCVSFNWNCTFIWGFNLYIYKYQCSKLVGKLGLNAWVHKANIYWFVLQDYVPEDIGSISGFEPPQSPDSSYNNMQLGSEDFAKEPPLVPPHLQMTLLNAPSSYMEMPPPLSRPQHVVLNHLYMQRGKSGPSVVALGTTERFIAKYVTVVLYKSLQR